VISTITLFFEEGELIKTTTTTTTTIKSTENLAISTVS